MMELPLQGLQLGYAGYVASLSLGFEVVIAIFVASVLGSLHCVGMCGPFMALATGTNSFGRPDATIASDGGIMPAQTPPKLLLQSAYHVGRLTTYLTLGLTASILSKLAGISLEHLSAPKWISVGGFAGAVILSIGVWRAIGRLPNPASPHQHVHISGRGFQSWGQLISKVRRKVQSKSPTINAYLWGLFSTLLPCGWLYLFVIAATASPSPAWAMLTMMAFWLGTLPALALLSVAFTSASKKFQWIQHPATTCVILGLGIYLMVSRSMEANAVDSLIHTNVQASRVGKRDGNVPHDETGTTATANSEISNSEISNREIADGKLSAEFLIELRQSLNRGLPHCGPWNPSLIPLPTHAN